MLCIFPKHFSKYSICTLKPVTVQHFGGSSGRSNRRFLLDILCDRKPDLMDDNFFLFVLVGFVAEMIDGSLGMGYGVTSTTFLLSLGLPPATASASVHASEIVTTASSGFFHLRFGNVKKDLVLRLLIPGIVGGVIGAYFLTELPVGIIKPIVTAYLILMGLVIIFKAFRPPKAEPHTPLVPLGLVGGFFDAVGGGGWGPIVTTTLVARGNQPRYVVGSVNLAEFFVTVSESVTFFLTIGFFHWNVIVGLMLGGVVATPIAAFFARRLPFRPFMIGVGILIIVTSARSLYLALK